MSRSLELIPKAEAASIDLLAEAERLEHPQRPLR